MAADLFAKHVAKRGQLLYPLLIASVKLNSKGPAVIPPLGKEGTEKMRIALMSPGNDCCGVAIHAWLVGSAWLSRGHELIVLASTDERPKGRVPLDRADEPFVKRCWEMYRYGDRIEDDAPLGLFFDPKPFLEEDFDVFFVEKPCSTPLSALSKIFDDIRRKGPVVAIMHEGRPLKNKRFYGLTWDAASLFDERYMALYGRSLPARRVEVIPYPFHPVREGDKGEARSSLGLPEEPTIVLAFGMRAGHLWPVMPILSELADELDIKLLILAKHEEALRASRALRARYGFVEIRREAPAPDRLYRYLHASDAVLLHRRPAPYVPVSSTVHLCLGSMRPILCSDNNFFTPYDGFVIKYRTPGELREKLKAVLNGDSWVGEVLDRARHVIGRFSADKIATRLLDLARAS